MDLSRLLKDLEHKLCSSFKELIDQALLAFRSRIDAELQSFRKSIESLSKRVIQLEEKAIQVHDATCHSGDMAPVGATTGEVLSSKLSSASYAQVVAQDQLLELKSKVERLTTKQFQLETSNEREKRKCNVLIGNLRERDSETADEVAEVVEELLTGTLEVNCKPVQVMRIGKHVNGKNRLVLVKMKSFRDRGTILRAAKRLRGSPIFIMEDLSKSERSRRKVLVEKLKIARSEGKKAFIRYTDGKLIVNGEAVDDSLITNIEGNVPHSHQ